MSSDPQYRRFPRRHPLHTKYPAYSNFGGRGSRWAVQNGMAPHGIYFMVECPKCGAVAYERCSTSGGLRVLNSFHRARTRLAGRLYETLLIIGQGPVS